jgi:hypothetical protein
MSARHETALNVQSAAMQEASAAARGMQIHGLKADRRAFLPKGSAFSFRLLGLAVT